MRSKLNLFFFFEEDDPIDFYFTNFEEEAYTKLDTLLCCYDQY